MKKKNDKNWVFSIEIFAIIGQSNVRLRDYT